MEYKANGYKLISYKPIIIRAKSERDAERKMKKMVKEKKYTKIKSENYFIKLDRVK